MSGRRIDDHSFFAGGKSKGSIFPEGVHVKHEVSAEGVGSVAMYEDTTDKIKAAQMRADKKVKSHPKKEFERN